MTTPITYISNVNSKSVAEIVFASVYFDLATKKINAAEADAILQHVKDVYIVNTHPSITEYLQTIKERATPEAIRVAKKTLQGYMKYLVYQDLKEAKISSKEAETAIVTIPDFLTIIRMNNEAN